MRKTLDELVKSIRANSDFDTDALDSLIRRRNREEHDGTRRIAKRRLLPVYLECRKNKDDFWRAWNLSTAEDERIIKLLRAKPRRTASGVATVTLLTKPWPCSNDCIYCPNDIRMPKSYLSDEPACQRAIRCAFDPYLQTYSRLSTLKDMGHITDKVEIIVLGGTWDDYPESYRVWFVLQVFRALNEFGTEAGAIEAKRRRSALGVERYVDEYKFGQQSSTDAQAHDGLNDLNGSLDLKNSKEKSEYIQHLQNRIDAGELSYNDAFRELGDIYSKVIDEELLQIDADTASMQIDESDGDSHSVKDISVLYDKLIGEQIKNEDAACRCVGLVFETQPEKVSSKSLEHLRRLGCTKLQIGIQSTDDEILKACRRVSRFTDIKSALSLMRLYGFKTHVHIMDNLPLATPESDIQQFKNLVDDPALRPDEVKLYPCALVASSHLMDEYENKRWTPYSEDVLTSVLVDSLLVTPVYMRISRMIRDISSKDIVAGNKKTNLRQMVETKAQSTGKIVHEMRMREIACDDLDLDSLTIDVVSYDTLSTQEYFLQYIDQKGRLAAFLRLSLPDNNCIQKLKCENPECALDDNDAMIREVHVYGRVSRLHESDAGNQHVGLGRKLVDKAKSIAASNSYNGVKVISAIGTKGYYRKLGFEDAGLYQRASLIASSKS